MLHQLIKHFSILLGVRAGYTFQTFLFFEKQKKKRFSTATCLPAGRSLTQHSANKQKNPKLQRNLGLAVQN